MVAELTDWGSRTVHARSPYSSCCHRWCRTRVFRRSGPDMAGDDNEFQRAQHEEDARALQSMLDTLDTLPVPLIGRIHGRPSPEALD